VAGKFKTILKGLDNGFTKLRTDFEKEDVEKLYRPTRRGLPEALIVPPEGCKFLSSKVTNN
jgi:hypothetical protein